MVLDSSTVKEALAILLGKEKGLCHATVLQSTDPLVAAIDDTDSGTRLFAIEERPTAEVLAKWIGLAAAPIINKLSNGRVRVLLVEFSETGTTTAQFHLATA